jgi:nitrous oxidase accessory protein NosD
VVAETDRFLAKKPLSKLIMARQNGSPIEKSQKLKRENRRETPVVDLLDLFKLAEYETRVKKL